MPISRSCGLRLSATRSALSDVIRLTAKSKDCDAGSHLALDSQGYLEYQLLDAVDCTSLNNRALVALAASGEVAKSRDGVALNLLVLVERKEADERLQEASLDNRRFIRGVNGDVANASSRGEHQRKVGRVEEAKERLKAVCLHDVNLVLLYEVSLYNERRDTHRRWPGFEAQVQPGTGP